jgi:hypothetical protein
MISVTTSVIFHVVENFKWAKKTARISVMRNMFNILEYLEERGHLGRLRACGKIILK